MKNREEEKPWFAVNGYTRSSLPGYDSLIEEESTLERMDRRLLLFRSMMLRNSIKDLTSNILKRHC